MSIEYDRIPTPANTSPLWPKLLAGLAVFMFCLINYYPKPAAPYSSLVAPGTGVLPWSIDQVKISGLALATKGVEARKLPAFQNKPGQHFVDRGNRVRMVMGAQLTVPGGQIQVGAPRAELFAVMKSPPYPKPNGDRLSWQGPGYIVRVQLEHDKITYLMIQELNPNRPGP